MIAFLNKGTSLNSSRLFFALAMVCGVLLSACSDVSDVTDPGSREDIASWFHGEGASSSSQAVSSSSLANSSSSSLQSSSSIQQPSSSSSATVSSNSSVPLSSSIDIASSSSMEPSSSSQVIDSILDKRDNQYYTTVVIGTQTWMAENLAYLPSVYTTEDTSSSKIFQYVYGLNVADVDEAKSSLYYARYGVLYNWTAAMNGSAASSNRVQGICPEGWHLPSVEEWQTLVDYAGGADIAAAKLKANSSLWSSGAGSDELSFSALPGGYFNGSTYWDDGTNGYWWTSTEYGINAADVSVMHYDNKQVATLSRDKGGAYSVRCVKDP